MINSHMMNSKSMFLADVPITLLTYDCGDGLITILKGRKMQALVFTQVDKSNTLKVALLIFKVSFCSDLEF